MDSSHFWVARPVFVTGCTGFLGSWVVRELLDRGANVVGLIRNRTPDSVLLRERLHSRIHIVRGTLSNTTTLSQSLAVSEAEAVFHLAATPVEPVLRAVRECGLQAQIVVPGPDVHDSWRVVAANLPTVFGPGDRHRERLVPRTARALLTGEWAIPPRRVELDARHIFAADAARFLVDLAESQLDPLSTTEPTLHTLTGAEVVEALKHCAHDEEARADLSPEVHAAIATLAWLRDGTTLPMPMRENAAA